MKKSEILFLFSRQDTPPYVEFFNKMAIFYLSAHLQLFIRSIRVKSELPLTTLSNPFANHTDESEKKTLHS